MRLIEPVFTSQACRSQWSERMHAHPARILTRCRHRRRFLSHILPILQGSDGGALEVKQGGEAVYLVPVNFAANSVARGYSGGALHVDGKASA